MYIPRTTAEYKAEASSITFPVEIVTHSNKHADLKLNLQKVQEIEANAGSKGKALKEVNAGLEELLNEVNALSKTADVKIDISPEGLSEAETARLEEIAKEATDAMKEAMKEATDKIKNKAKALQRTANAARTNADSEQKLLHLFDKKQQPLPDKFKDIEVKDLKGAFYSPRFCAAAPHI
jgi:hypothetical protein